MEQHQFAVVIPTYRRPTHLARCLEALRRQSFAPAEIVVVRRDCDDETLRVLANHPPGSFTDVKVSEPGVLAALMAGAKETTAPLVAFTDDDAAPWPDWLERLSLHFRDPCVGVVGGRDVVHERSRREKRLPATDVGRITRWGKLIGNHEFAIGPSRQVEVLKGVNMAFRRQAVAFPLNLRGAGAQPHYEVAMCLWAINHGWRVMLDPQAVVDHFPGPRFDEDRRERPTSAAIRDTGYNLVASILTARPNLLWRRASFGLFLGDKGVPGIGRAVLGFVRGENMPAVLPSLAGQARALMDIIFGRRVELVSLCPDVDPRRPAERERGS
jgi:GT2 family glycosyltransferase